VWLVLFIAAAIAAAVEIPLLPLSGSSHTVSQDGMCSPVTLLIENFDGVTPPALPLGWSSTTWITSNSGAPMPPADTPPNAAFVDDPASISDKQLFSPSIFLVEGGEPVQITFRNNFDFQDGFDGGVLEISRAGTPFQDILAVGGTFVSGGYNGTISWGPNMVLRWRMGSDSSVSGQGWRIDGVVVTQCHKPVPSATPPPTASPTARPQMTPRSRPSQAPRPTP